MSLLGEGRAGFAVAKAVGSIARRNRLKRRLREAYRAAAGSVPRAYDYVVAASAGARELSHEQLVAALKDALAKLDARWESDSD
jgi:ribonuclease P protein component